MTERDLIVFSLHLRNDDEIKFLRKIFIWNFSLFRRKKTFQSVQKLHLLEFLGKIGAKNKFIAYNIFIYLFIVIDKRFRL